MTVTPGVVVVSVAELAVASAQPLFFNSIFRLTHSLRLMTPLPLPMMSRRQSSRRSPRRFEVPVMVKFWVVVPPLVMVTVADWQARRDVQLRSASAAVAV